MINHKLNEQYKIMAKKMKVSYKWQNKKCVPSVILSGQWLEDLGFFVGHNVEIFTMEDTILIKRK